MTEAGKEFVSRWELVEQCLARPREFTPFSAMAFALAENDWLLIVAAMRRMVKEIKDQK